MLHCSRMPLQSRKRPVEQTTTATKDIQKLYQYAGHVNERLPGISSAENIFSFLNLVNSKMSAKLMEPCCANGTQLCHILDHLSVCNEFLQLADMELKEVEPGEFGVFALKTDHKCGGQRGPCINGWTLLHWLLQEHCCIKTLALPWTMNPQYQGLLSDALHHNTGLIKLTLRDWQAEGGFTDIISAIGTLGHLEELDMGRVDLPATNLGDLGSALQQISTLKTLMLPSLETCTSDTEPEIYVTEFIEGLEACSNMVALASDDYVLEPGLGDAFAEFVAESSSLRKLSLCQSACYSDQLDTLFTAVGQNNNIKELRLNGFSLYDDAEELLAKVVAQHTGLQRLEVGFYGDYKEWDMCGTALADLLGQNTGLRELVFVGSTVCCLPAFAGALRKNTTMEKLTLGLVGMDIPDYRLFLQALACNESLKLVTFEEWSYPNFNDIVLLMQETGTEGRLEINADVSNPRDLENGLKNSTNLTKVRYSPSYRSSPMMPGAFRHLVQQHHLQELYIRLDHAIETECATSLALLLSTTSSLRCATLEFLATAASTEILMEGLASNKSLTSLSISYWTFKAPEADLLWHTLGSSRTLKTLKLDLLDFGQGQVLDHVPDDLLNNHCLLEANIQQNHAPTLYAYCLGVREQIVRKLTVVSTQTFQSGVLELLRRNLSTLHRATQFVKGSRGRRFAEAFERLSECSAFVEALKKATGESEQEIERRIASCTRYLDEHFLAEAGVVRETVVCGASSEVQLDRIGFYNWLHIRQYLKVSDIIWTPRRLLAGPSSSKKHC